MSITLDFDPRRSEGPGNEVEVDWSKVDLPGWFEAKINYEAVKQTRSGNGRFLAVAFRITAGDPTGATVWGQFTLSNPNEKAVAIGREQIGEIMWATGLPKGANSRALVGKRLMVRVVMETNDRFGDKPKPVAFKPKDREPGFDPGVDPEPPDDGYPASRGEGPSPAGEDPDDDFPF